MTKIINKISTIFTTFDLSLAVTLITIGFQLIDLEKSNPRKVQFLFKDSIELQKAVNDYWSDKHKVNPRVYFDNLKMLKSRLYTN